MRTERAEALIRRALTEGRVQPFIRSKVRKHIEAPMTQMLLGEPQVKQMAAALARHGFTHESSMAFNSKVAHHKFKRGHRLITVTRFKEPGGNRVIWSSAGLTGHGQDGRGEHYTTLTTHLRAITPRRVHEEQSRFKIEPAPNSGIPPDFADYRNRAWLSPTGKVHALKQGTPEEPWRGDTHGGWAVNNPHVHGEHGDLWTMFDNMQANGWVRKTAKDFYDIGPYNEDSIATVHKHFTTHHPELDSVRVYSREGGGTLHRLYKGSVNEETSRFIVKPSLDDAPSDWAEMHNRAWISPKGEVHPLTHRDEDGHEYNQTHFDFADTAVGVGQTWDGSYRKLLNGGWIRKVSHRSYHVGHESVIPRVLDHLRKHHPDVELARVMVHSGPVLRTQREHLRYLTKDGEVYEATTPPTSIQWGDPNWFNDREHAWISPDGEYHKLHGGEHHFNWAVKKGQDFYRMLNTGWVRKADKAIYQVGNPVHFQRVFQHVNTEHPEVGRISITHPEEPLGFDKATVFNKVGGQWHPEKNESEEPVHAGPAEIRAIAKRAKLDISRHDMKQLVMGMKAETEHDKPGDTDIIKGSKTQRAEKLLKVALAHVREKGDYYTRLKKVEESWIDKRDAGWIAPDDTYHQLPKGSVHDLWIKNNGPLLAAHGVKQDAFGYDKRAIIAAGWIQKHGENVYSAHDRSAVPRIVKHFTERHPGVKRVMISFKTGGNVYVTRDGTVKEPVPYRAEESVQENWMLSRKAAWISPEGEVHALKPGQFHAHWVSDNEDRIHPSLHRSSPFETEDAMIRQGGWIKKQDRGNYHAAPGSLDRVLDHFTTHHPELSHVRVSGAGRLGTDVILDRDGKVGRAMVYENWLATRHAAWISPDDREHRLRGEEFHTDWIRRNAATHVPEEHHKYYQYDGADDGLDAYGTKDKMLAAGWIRKQDKNVYYVHDPAAMKERIVKHVRQNHPEINRVRINSPQDELWVDVDHGKKVNEAWRGGTLDNWLQHRTAGWIAPDHTYHQLNPGEHHREWSTNPRNARHLRDVLRVIDPARHWDANVVQHEMMKQGWIRKLDHDQYLVGRRSMIAQALRHHERFHPHKNRVEVAVENYPTQGSMHRFYFQRDPNTREILPRRDWREKRRLRKSQQDQKWGSSA